MSILNFPRIHFSGWCLFHKPTGNQNKAGNINLTTNEIYKDQKKVDSSVKAEAFYEYYRNLGTKYNSVGKEDIKGIFNLAAGRDFEGNSRVLWNAKVINTQTKFGSMNTKDALIGRPVELWGHYNEYLGTTFNQPKVVELDSASLWTTQIYAGHFTLGRDRDFITSSSLINGSIREIHHARLYKDVHILNLSNHWNNEEIRRAVVYQFVLDKDDTDFYLNDEHVSSDTLAAFRNSLNSEMVKGIMVQYCLFNATEPEQPNTPTFYSLVGTVGIWYGDQELTTYPTGRILYPSQEVENKKFVEGLGFLSIELFKEHLSLNMSITLPIDGRHRECSKTPIPEHGEFYFPYDLYLFSQGFEAPLALIPSKSLKKDFYYNSSGIFDRSYLIEINDEIWEQISQFSLFVAIQNEVGNFITVLQEKETIIQVNKANIYLEIPCYEKEIFFDECLEVRSFVRGVPSAVKNIHLYQVYNPANYPFNVEEFKQRTLPTNEEHKICLVQSGHLAKGDKFQTELEFDTNEEGRATITLRGLKSGGGRILFTVEESEKKIIQHRLDKDPFEIYDNNNILNFWDKANVIHIKVLSNDWKLLDVPHSQVNFQFMYENVLQFYELIYPFMNREVFSFENQAKTEINSSLSWQMCDHANKFKSYYMPPTRELSYPKFLLFKHFMMNVSKVGYVPCSYKRALVNE